MKPTALLAELKHPGVSLAVENGQLRCRLPRGALTPDLRAALAERKAIIKHMLTARRCGCGTTSWWWRAVKCDTGRWVGDWLCSRCHPEPDQESRPREPTGQPRGYDG